MSIIFFNVPEARDQLLTKGVVYTLRPRRSTGPALAVTGTRYKHASIARVNVELADPDLIVVISHGTIIRGNSQSLQEHIKDSGFRTVDSWVDCGRKMYPLKIVTLYLFKVTLIEVIVRINGGQV